MSQQIDSPGDLRPPEREPLPRAFYTALAATVFFSMGLTVLIPVLPLFITDGLGAGEQWVGTATLFVAFMAVASRIPSGALSDHYGRRQIMLIGAVLGVVASGIYLSVNTVGVFMVARLMTGASLALFTTTGKALSADLAPAARRGEAMGLNNAAFSLATVISPLLSEGLKNAVGFWAVFAVSGALTLLSLLVTLALPTERPDRTGSLGARRDMLQTLHERGSWAALLLIMSMGAILALMFTFYPLLAERKDFFADAPGVLSSVAMGMGLSIWAAVDSVVEPLAGAISDRIGRQPVAIPGMLGAVGGVWLLGRADDTASVYVAIAILTAGWGAARAVADSLSQDVVPPVLRGMGAAVLYTGFDLSVGVNAQLLSILIDGSDFGTFFVVLEVIVVSLGLLGLALATRLVTYDQRATYSHPSSAPAPSSSVCVE